MATLTIRNVDEDIRDHLRRQAARHRRSMEAEVRAILAGDLRQKTIRPGTIANRIHKRFAAIGGGDDLPLLESPPLGNPVVFDK